MQGKRKPAKTAGNDKAKPGTPKRKVIAAANSSNAPMGQIRLNWSTLAGFDRDARSVSLSVGAAFASFLSELLDMEPRSRKRSSASVIVIPLIQSPRLSADCPTVGGGISDPV